MSADRNTLTEQITIMMATLSSGTESYGQLRRWPTSLVMKWGLGRVTTAQDYPGLFSLSKESLQSKPERK